MNTPFAFFDAYGAGDIKILRIILVEMERGGFFMPENKKVPQIKKIFFHFCPKMAVKIDIL